ncbi:hypothetical protein [Pseudomonas antarctica]|uniref:hypothetical protein n=1 Tax=Pseudomonas antarctica TaxID=219572 RepID=UPI003F74AFAC
MSAVKVEYLSVINSKEGFCNSAKAFNNLLQSYENIKITGSKIASHGKIFEYDVQCGEIQDNSQMFFHVKLTCTDAKDITTFKILLKSIRTLLTKASEKPPEVLWDDISSSFAIESYPLIHEIENMMRKLITKFMLTKVGLGWTKETVPKEVSESIKTKRNGSSHNYLFEADFIQLSNFLFKSYSTANSKTLVEKVKTAQNITDLNINELKELVPTSNWEKYFLPIVNCKSEHLETRWEKLYELRCLVAHNNFISNEDFESIKRICIEVKDQLSEALKNLDKIHISAEQKEEVAENIATNLNSLHGDIILKWNSIQHLIIELTMSALDHVEAHHLIKSKTPTHRLVKSLIEKDIIPNSIGIQIDTIRNLRNEIVHNNNINIGHHEALKYLTESDEIKLYLAELLESFNPEQKSTKISHTTEQADN